MIKNAPLMERISAEAADWFARLQDPNEPDTLREEFVEWLLRSPEHVKEFLANTRAWGDIELAGPDTHSVEALIAAANAEPAMSNVVALSPVAELGSPATSRSNRANRTPHRHIAAAAVLAFLILGAGLWWALGHGFGSSTIRTAIGEQRSLILPDGSLVDINTNSEIRIERQQRERRVQVLRGEAHFQVAKDPTRAFIVSTPQAAVRALGTAFDVYARPERTEVAVLEGQVELRELGKPVTQASVRAAPAVLRLEAGQQASVNPDGDILPNIGAPLIRVAAWREHRLIFRDEPLSDVIAEFNRYHERPIRIKSSQLATIRISGTFDSTNPDSLLAYLERFEKVRVARGADATWLERP